MSNSRFQEWRHSNARDEDRCHNLLLALDRLTVVRPSFDLGTVISADYISDNVASLLRQRIDTVN